jgi:hypothetical protein
MWIGNEENKTYSLYTPLYHLFALFSPSTLFQLFAMKLTHHRLLFPFLLAFAFARDIIFPPVAGYQQTPIREFGGIDISTGSAFSGLTTFANVPYVHCLADEGRKVEKFDIAILGAPFDTVGLIF